MSLGDIVVAEYFLMYCFRLGFSGIFLNESQGLFSLVLACICSVCPLSGFLRANLRAFFWLKCLFHSRGSSRGSKSSWSDDGVPWERKGVETDVGLMSDNKPTLCFMKISGATVPVISPPRPPLPVKTENKNKKLLADLSVQRLHQRRHHNLLFGFGSTVVSFLIRSDSTLCFRPLGSWVIFFRC